MSFLKMVPKFISLDLKTKFLFIEAFIFLGWARFLLNFPFSKVAHSLGLYMIETSNSENSTDKASLKRVYGAIDLMSKYTFWESKCLVKAIAGMKMLKRRQIDSTLYLGTTKDESGKMIAHAWLRSGSYYITGAEGMGRFTVVSKFANTIPRKK
jgi:hypothetical protein